ncbi:MAG: T9SS type A sorting domain-containing protein, partial [Candidatus Latescibacterota bacterium]
SSGLNWDQMNNGQRAASAVNTGNVVWDGPAATALSGDYLGGQPIMTVNSPPSLPPTIAVGTAAFGPSLTETGVTGDLVLVDDGTGTTTDACEPLINGGAISGNIALIDRGSCTFVSKALAAQTAGAIAVVIANNVAGGTPITLGGSDPSVVIPVVSITLDDGNAIKAELGSGVNITLHLDPNQLAGADANGRVKLYAPNPYQGGSSISHWDVSALPNLLMEPAINGNLSSDVDLTLPHFSDIGWLDVLTGVGDDDAPQIADAPLLSSYPNPFNPSTTIRYVVTEAQDIRMAIYDVKGRLVRTLVNGFEAAGVHNTTWDGIDNADNPVASGIYFVRLAADGKTTNIKIVLLK